MLLGGVRVPGWRLRAGRRGGEWHAAAVDPRCAHHTGVNPPALAPAYIELKLLILINFVIVKLS